MYHNATGIDSSTVATKGPPITLQTFAAVVIKLPSFLTPSLIQMILLPLPHNFLLLFFYFYLLIS